MLIINNNNDIFITNIKYLNGVYEFLIKDSDSD